MKYNTCQLLEMSQRDFFDTFNKKYVRIAYDKKGIEHSIEGLVEKIGLACNINPDTNDHLPCSVMVCGTDIAIEMIKEIEV